MTREDVGERAASGSEGPLIGTITTGIGHLDELLRGLIVGENVVWETDSGSRHDVFIGSFVRAALANGQTVVYVSFNRSPATMQQALGEFWGNKRFLLIDCFTSGKGKDDRIFRSFYDKRKPDAAGRIRRIENPGDAETFVQEMNRIEDECGEGPRYVFDSLTGMQDLWGDETRAYKYFTYTCPRLYDLKTIAYWIIEREAHTRSFCANIRHVTQVVIGLARHKGLNSLQIVKADGRSLGPLHFDQQYEVVEDEIRFADVAKKQLDRIGERMRVARLAKRMSQAEVARLLGITGSTISQAENGLISLSLQHVVNLARVLDVNPSHFFDTVGHVERGGPVYHRSARVEVFPDGDPLPGVSISALRPEDAEANFNAYIAAFEPGQKLNQHFFATKTQEFGLVLSGKLQVQVGKAKHELAEGDSIFLEDQSPSAWRNLSEDQSAILWICGRP